MANIPLKSIKFPDLADTYTVPSNAGELPYNKSATYPADTVGKALQNIGDSSAPAIIETAQGSIASFTDGANVPVKDLTAEIVPLQSGSGDPSPSNVRAISGWSECNVSVMGKNLIAMNRSPASPQVDNLTTIVSQTAKKLEFTTSSSGNYANTRLTYRLPKGTYTLSIKATSSDSFTPVVSVYNGSTLIANDVSQSTPKSFTLTEDADINFRFFGSTNTASARTVSFYDVQLELGSTATTYEPYNGEVYTISFASAGTVYGGRLDVTSGVLTVTWGGVNIGDVDWTYSPSPNEGFYCDSVGAKPAESVAYLPNAISSIFKVLDYNEVFAKAEDNIFSVRTNGGLRVYTSLYTDASAFETAMNGQIIAFELETPQTYQLTPTEVKTLLKNNNIWADTGDVTVEYVADTKTFIENLVNA